MNTPNIPEEAKLTPKERTDIVFKQFGDGNITSEYDYGFDVAEATAKAQLEKAYPIIKKQVEGEWLERLEKQAYHKNIEVGLGKFARIHHCLVFPYTEWQALKADTKQELGDGD